MFCKYCGNLIAEDSKFCSRCGRNITEVINTASAQPQYTADQQYNTAQPQYTAPQQYAAAQQYSAVQNQTAEGSQYFDLTHQKPAEEAKRPEITVVDGFFFKGTSAKQKLIYIVIAVIIALWTARAATAIFFPEYLSFL